MSHAFFKKERVPPSLSLSVSFSHLPLFSSLSILLKDQIYVAFRTNEKVYQEPLCREPLCRRINFEGSVLGCTREKTVLNVAFTPWRDLCSPLQSLKFFHFSSIKEPLKSYRRGLRGADPARRRTSPSPHCWSRCGQPSKNEKRCWFVDWFSTKQFNFNNFQVIDC